MDSIVTRGFIYIGELMCCERISTLVVETRKYRAPLDKCMIGLDVRYIRIKSPTCYNVLAGRDGFNPY